MPEETMDGVEKNKYGSLQWPAYDQKHRKYMDISEYLFNVDVACQIAVILFI